MNPRGQLWKVSVSTTPEAEDAVTELLHSFFEQPVSSYTDVETGEVTVATYLSRSALKNRRVLECAALHDGLRRIQRCRLNIGSGEITFKKIRREDWAESWKRHFKPIEIASALLIKPGWARQRPKKGQAVVILDPGLSFGTGQHPTTAFCLQELVTARFKFRASGFAVGTRPFRKKQKLETQNSKPAFLDIGTGSGILAIAAAKLDYAPVDAFDFDPEAVRIALGNARKNRVSRRVRITRADVTKLAIRSRKQYDLICANLISTLLVAEHRRILSRLKRNGVLVVAGILGTEFAQVQKAYERAGLRLVASRTKKEWRSGAFTYRGQKR
jgi:ribosomal protein L11 methyltransferase